ncbi:C-5 cytosine-specific DNA methylase [Burkholderia pseudomallei]|nr:C-5 cytosine-specific DNA methylase [Burkholderia pseudomallei]
MIRREYKVFTMCSGLGGGAKGFQEAMSQVGEKVATWRCIGGIDNDPGACRDFKQLVGVDCTLMDLFTRSQYTAFNGAEPPAGWREATSDDIRRAAGNEHPHCVFISSPCKGASGLLSETLSRTPKYQALNELTLRCVWLMCEAWKDDPVELIVFENVPRLMTRARHLLDQIGQILRHYGYVVNETTHDCGEIGELAQSRKRFLLVARHAEKVPAFLYQPTIHRLQGVGTVLGRMPLPGDTAGGPMHRIPSLQWKTWVRLAFVEAGSDWRSLNRLSVEDGYLRDYLIVPDMHNGALGVRRWDEPSGVVAGASRPMNGTFSVADPRAPADALHYRNYGVVQWADPSGAIIGVKSPGQGMFSVADPRAVPSDRWNHGQNYGVVPWSEPSGTISGQQWPNQGRFAVADPRHNGTPKHNNEFRVVPWDIAAGAVTSAHGTGQCVQDPRPPAGPLFSKYKVTEWDSHAGTVIGGDDQGAYAVADPRPGIQREKGDSYLTGGHYGVIAWEQASGAVSASACHDNGRWSVADPRLPAANEKTVAVIRALDGTWHRPFTTLELAALQSLVEPEEQLELDGLSDQAWRERIGNAVPPKAAKAVAEVMGTTLLLAESGETFMLSSTPIWVRSVAIALSLPSGDKQ